MLQDLTPALEPIQASHEADELEAQFKQMTMEVFQESIRFLEREINVFGAPHLGSFEQVERWVKADGLAMVRGEDEDSMRYLFKAWRGQNPKRGLHFLRTYLQLLWPNGWSVSQLWQKKTAPYPLALATKDDFADGVDPAQTHYLTSRVNVDIETDEESGLGLSQVAKSIRYICGAKFLLALRVLRQSRMDFRMASIFSGTDMLLTSGSLIPLDGSGELPRTRASAFDSTNMLITTGSLK